MLQECDDKLVKYFFMFCSCGHEGNVIADCLVSIALFNKMIHQCECVVKTVKINSPH